MFEAGTDTAQCCTRANPHSSCSRSIITSISVTWDIAESGGRTYSIGHDTAGCTQEQEDLFFRPAQNLQEIFSHW